VTHSEVEKQQSWKPLIAIALSMVMMYITTFGVNVLISAIVDDLKTTVANLQFVIVAASLVAGSLMVTAGRLGDRFGKKNICHRCHRLHCRVDGHKR
jgi:MFS family permease